MMQKVLKIILVLLILSPLHLFAETTPPIIPETHFGNGRSDGTSNNPGATDMNDDWWEISSEDNCKREIQRFPFGRLTDPENNNVRKTLNPAISGPQSIYAENSDPSTFETKRDKVRQLVAPCFCMNNYQENIKQKLNLIFSRDLRQATTQADRIAAQNELTIRLQKKYWIEDHLLNTNSICKLIRFNQTQQSAVNGTRQPDQINYCIYQDDALTEIPENIRNHETLVQYDTNRNCKIDNISDDSKEKCQVYLKSAQEHCRLNPSTKSDTLAGLLHTQDQYQTGRMIDGRAETIQIDTVCSNLRYFGCLAKDKPEYLNLETGFSSDSLDVNKVLKTEGQIGFQGIGDQGAGSNNPAINFLLKIMNILSNLSFLVSVFFLIMGGFYLVIASGNSEMTDKGKTAIKNFIFAITFTLLSYTIVVIIRTLLYS